MALSSLRSSIRTSRASLAPTRLPGSTCRSSLPFRSAFHSSPQRAQEAPAPVKKPVGAFRGGLLGFFAGTTLAGAAVYFHILEEYRVSNELLTEDIYSLQAAVQRIEAYTRSLEETVNRLQRKQ